MHVPGGDLGQGTVAASAVVARERRPAGGVVEALQQRLVGRPRRGDPARPPNVAPAPPAARRPAGFDRRCSMLIVVLVLVIGRHRQRPRPRRPRARNRSRSSRSRSLSCSTPNTGINDAGSSRTSRRSAFRNACSRSPVSSIWIEKASSPFLTPRISRPSAVTTVTARYPTRIDALGSRIAAVSPARDRVRVMRDRSGPSRPPRPSAR